MDFLKLPTDNLYKFISIAGLLLFGVSAIYPYFIMKEVDMRIAEMGKLNGTMSLQNEEARDALSKTRDIAKQIAADIPKAKSQREFQRLDDQLEAAATSNERVLLKARDAQKTGVEFDYVVRVNDFYMGAFHDAVRWSKRGIMGSNFNSLRFQFVVRQVAKISRQDS